MGMQPFIKYREQHLKDHDEKYIEALRETLKKNVSESKVNETSFHDVRTFLLLAKDQADLNLILSNYKL
jgi:hypothetical protein